MKDYFKEAVKDTIQSIADSVSESLERGLDKAADRALNALREASPRGELADAGETPYRDKWYIKDQYPRVRYITNNKMVSGPDGEIPLKQLLEYGTERNMPAQPHIQSTFDAIEEELSQIILNEIDL